MTLTIVTGANAPFARTLMQFLLSVRRRGLQRSARIAVYDLGLTGPQRLDIARRFPFADVLPFSFDDKPAHVAVGADTFAWKPLAISDAAGRFGGRLFWFDSATLFHGDLSEPLGALEETGVYTLEGQSSLAQRCLAEVRDHLKADPDDLHRKIRIGGVLGIDLDAPAARDLLAEWARLARDPLAFRPAAPDHNADQAVLTILLFRFEREGRLRLNAGEIDISSAAPVRWMSSRNKVAAHRALWMDPLVRLGYRVYKTVDRLNLRWQDFYRRRVLGLHRWPKEHFQTYVMRAGDAAPTPIPAPVLSYYADPFLWRHEGRLWLFVEEFEYRQQLGRLVAMELDDELRPGPVIPVLPLREHASYPYLFQHDGRLYMLPETCALGALDLYVCERFPDRWRRARRLLEGVDAVDSVLFEREGWWWLLTNAKPLGADGGRSLALYRMRDPANGPLVPHPVIAQGLFANRDHGYGRGAGSLFQDQDGPLRVVQKNDDYYGQAAEVRRIVALNEADYRDEAVDPDHPLARLATLVSPHHISLQADAVAFDLRDRLGFVSGMPWIGRRLNGIAPAAKRILAGDPAVEAAVARVVSRLVAQTRPADGRPPSSDPQDGE
ncbi:glucosamine inositolphosphorylceramide transferase family protein [Stappia stellulata]|uniref:glucosamine inositolphosphorylceramide transferase family protein n=1 Tax=Stappia stellulata TaxID=71235 RepID=UPI0004155BED|nr:hypothetical protein [Stappia stellulata]